MTPGSCAAGARSRPAFAGIDVAIARSKRLPVCVCVRECGRLVPLPRVTPAGAAPPRGMGNVAACEDDGSCGRFAEDAAAYLRAVEREFDVTVVRIAIDAPRAPAPSGGRRVSELELSARGIPYFVTPDEAGWALIRERVRCHLGDGGRTDRLPHANQLWMLAGFALFETLQPEWECLEVFPHAIGLALAAAGRKATAAGLDARLAAVARHTGWPQPSAARPLDQIAFGARHDKLDAYLCAWVASLEERDREALGTPPDDAIWVPRPSPE